MLPHTHRQSVLQSFRAHLIREEKSPATVEKYLRDAAGVLLVCHF